MFFFTREMASIIAEESNLYFEEKFKGKYGDNFKDYNLSKNYKKITFHLIIMQKYFMPI